MAKTNMDKMSIKKYLAWTIALLALCSSASAALTDDLQLYYRFEETALNYVDSEINLNFTTLGGHSAPTRTSGVLNYGQDFDGAADHIETVTDTVFESTNWTWCAWVKPDASNTRLLDVYNNNGATYYGFYFDIQGSGGTFSATYYTGSGSTSHTCKSSGQITAGIWQYVCAVSDEANNQCDLYINGTEVINYTTHEGGSDISWWSGNHEIKLGENFYAGDVDEMGMWTRELTSAEMTELYNSGAGLDPTIPPSQSNTTVNFTATDDFDNSIISTFTTQITWSNGTVQTETTTTGGVYLNLGLQNISLTANATYNTTDYYDLTVLNQAVTANTSNTVTANMYQAVVTMQATEKISSNTITGTYYTGSKSGATFNLTAADHNITFENSSYYNRTQEFTITALTNTTLTVTDVHTAEWNITVYSAVTGAVITNYDINLTSVNHSSWTGENSSSATGYYNFTGINGTYTAIIDATGYVPQYFNFTIDAKTGAANFSVMTTNNIDFTIYEEENQTVLAGYNITLELIGSNAAYNFSTMNGTLYVDLLSPQNYLIRYSDTNGTYAERFYYFNLTNRSSNSIDLYLLSTSAPGYAAITTTVYDETNHFVEGAIIKVLRYYLDTNSYIIVEMAKTNFEGVTTLHLKQNEEFYKFIVEYPQGTTKKETNPTQIYATTLNFQILLATETGARYENSLGVETSLTFDETNNRYRLYWNDGSNAMSQICMVTDRLTQFRNESVNNTCSTASTGIMYHAVNNITGYTYQSRALAYFSDPPATLSSLYYTFTAYNPIGTIGLFILILVTVVFMFIGHWNLAAAIVLTPIPTLLASIAQIIPIPAYVTVPLEIIAIIVAYLISTRA